METVVKPKQSQLEDLVAPYLTAQPSGLGFAIGYASPNFPGSGGFFFKGNIQNQLGDDQLLNEKTPFEIASISGPIASSPRNFLTRTMAVVLAHLAPIANP